MKHVPKILVIDAGNTVIKSGLFLGTELQQIQKLPTEEFQAGKQLSGVPEHDHCIISSVLNNDLEDLLLSHFPNAILLHHELNLPIMNAYATPDTLGKDRLSAAIGAYSIANTENVVVIDIGTCIKFDVVENGIYLGGSISPGLRLRFEALHQFTGQLPRIEFEETKQLIGNSTKASILSGVIQGMQAEIQGFIDQYENKYGRLTFFVTGGDAKNFDLAAKNDIFANENLTLIGLYEIFKVNAQ